jgi:hypothetical protein
VQGEQTPSSTNLGRERVLGGEETALVRWVDMACTARVLGSEMGRIAREQEICAW